MAKTSRRNSRNKTPKLAGVTKRRRTQTWKQKFKKQLFNNSIKNNDRNRKNETAKNISSGRQIKYARGHNSLNIRITCSTSLDTNNSESVTESDNTVTSKQTAEQKTLNDIYQTIDCIEDDDGNNDVIFVQEDSDVVFIENDNTPSQKCTTQDDTVIVIEDDSIIEVPSTPTSVDTAKVYENQALPSPIEAQKGVWGNASSTPIQRLPVIYNHINRTKNQRKRAISPILIRPSRSRTDISKANVNTVKITNTISPSTLANAGVVNVRKPRPKSKNSRVTRSETAFDRMSKTKAINSGNVKEQGSTSGSASGDQVATEDPKAKSVPGNKFGSNFLNAGPVRTQGLRPIFIDGSNVAMGHTNGKYFSVRGLQICINYFKMRGHEVTAIVPMFRKKLGQNSNSALLQFLEKEGTVIFTPSRRINGKNMVPYDDRYTVLLADEHKGIVVSSDNFQDLLAENPALLETIENRVLTPTWLKDMIIFPSDPLGRHGPKLDDFLKFP